MWEIPEPHSVLEVRVDNETDIVVRRHGNPAGPRVITSHGNGFAIDMYYPFWSLLEEDFDLVVYDLRNHGWNRVSALQNHNFPTFVRDLDTIADAVEQHYGKKATVGVFHSVSSLATLLSPTMCARFAGLILFDPPLCKANDSYDKFEAAAMRAAAMARRRTEVFTGPEQFVELLNFVPTFHRAVPGVIDLVARTTLRKNEEGEGYVLRCPRDYEAQIMDYARAFAVLVDLVAIHCPVKVLGADPTLPFSYLPSLDMSDILEVEYDYLPDTTHFLQLEKPEECVAEMRQFLRTVPLT